MIESDVRHQIDRVMEARGWILDARNPQRNVFFEGAVKNRLTSQSLSLLGRRRPDYTLFHGHVPLAIVEAKKPSVRNLADALRQAESYASALGVKIIFACNGSTFKTLHLETRTPLYLNNTEVTDFPTPEVLRRFASSSSNKVFTVPTEVIKSREQLIRVFETLNDDLRAEGIRAGIERFTEFANILFLKLLSENGSGEFWNELLRLNAEDSIDYLNHVAIKRLQDNYGGDVISQTRIRNASTLKKIVNTLNPLRLTDIDEDIKGIAFEHFIQRTTDTQNDLGEYFTPRHIVRFMVRLVNPKYGKSVYDPFCGTGGFLTQSFRHIGAQFRPTRVTLETLNTKTVFGAEITTTARIAKMNMILFGDGHSGVRQQDSLRNIRRAEFDNVLSNIPFSQNASDEVLNLLGGIARDADEACVLACFESLKTGGSMAIVVPEGLLVNRKKLEFLRYLMRNSQVRLIIRLPRGCFSPYTEAKTGILYLTDKGVGRTDWFFQAIVENDGFDSRRNPLAGINDLDKILFYFDSALNPSHHLPTDLDLSVVSVRNLQSKTSFYLHSPWRLDPGTAYTQLQRVAFLRNGKSITKAVTLPGEVPVIAGGRGTSPYSHNKSNYSGNVCTVSKSGAYAGYVWWHDDPIWASDCIVVQSKDEEKYLNRFLYMCLKIKQEEIYSRQQGTGQPHIYSSHIADFPIPVVTVEEQKAKLRAYNRLQSELERAKNLVRDSEMQLGQFLDELGHSYYLGD